MPEPKLIVKLKAEIRNCLLMEEADKSYWLENAELLPESILKTVIAKIEAKNKIMDQYLMAAMKGDPDGRYLNELKANIKKIKETAFAMEKNTDEKTAEEDLLRQMGNL